MGSGAGLAITLTTLRSSTFRSTGKRRTRSRSLALPRSTWASGCSRAAAARELPPVRRRRYPLRQLPRPHRLRLRQPPRRFRGTVTRTATTSSAPPAPAPAPPVASSCVTRPGAVGSGYAETVGDGTPWDDGHDREVYRVVL
jgi:hypothetical protein